jgi:hypothetical protein
MVSLLFYLYVSTQKYYMPSRVACSPQNLIFLASLGTLLFPVPFIRSLNVTSSISDLSVWKYGVSRNVVAEVPRQAKLAIFIVLEH